MNINISRALQHLLDAVAHAAQGVAERTRRMVAIAVAKLQALVAIDNARQHWVMS